MFAQGVTFYF